MPGTHTVPTAGPQILSLLNLPLLNPRDLAPRPGFAQTRSESELDIQGHADHAKDVRTHAVLALSPSQNQEDVVPPDPCVCPGRLAGPGVCKLTPQLPLFTPSLHTFIKEMEPECPCDWPWLGLTPNSERWPSKHPQGCCLRPCLLLSCQTPRTE